MPITNIVFSKERREIENVLIRFGRWNFAHFVYSLSKLFIFCSLIHVYYSRIIVAIGLIPFIFYYDHCFFRMEHDDGRFSAAISDDGARYFISNLLLYMVYVSVFYG